MHDVFNVHRPQRLESAEASVLRMCQRCVGDKERATSSALPSHLCSPSWSLQPPCSALQAAMRRAPLAVDSEVTGLNGSVSPVGGVHAGGVKRGVDRT